MRAIIYTRVSTEEQTHGYSLEGQREKCLKKAEELGATDTIIFEDAGVSGEVLNRPALMDAIALLGEKDFRLFLCTDPDRLSRQLGNLIAFTEQIEKHAELVFTDFRRESTAEGELFYSIRGAIAQFEKEMIKRRTVAGKVKKARQGGWTHWPDIFGYDYNAGEVTINEEEAQIVRLIFKLGTEMGIRKTANRLGLLGVKSPRAEKTTWSPTTVRRIILNDTYYTGKTYIRKYDSSGVHLNKYRKAEDKLKRKTRPEDEWVEMSLPPLIDEETWEKAKERLDNARRKSLSSLKGDYLLSGLLRCSHCGATWHGYSTVSKEKRRYYYVCTYRSPGPHKGSGLSKCETGFVQRRIFDEEIWQLVKGWLLDDSLIEQFRDQQKNTINSETDPHAEEIKLLEERIEQLGREEDALIERLSKEQNSRLRQKIGDQLDKIASEIDNVQKIFVDLKATRNEIAAAEVNKELVWAVRQKFEDVESMTEQEKSSAIHEFLREVIVQKSGDGYKLQAVPR